MYSQLDIICERGDAGLNTKKPSTLRTMEHVVG